MSCFHYYRANPLKTSLRQALSDLLAQTFINDPTYCYVLPDLIQRQRGLKQFFNALLLYSCQFGDCYILQNNEQHPVAAGLVLPPETKFISPWRIMRCRALFPMSRFIIRLITHPSALYRFYHMVKHIDQIQYLQDPSNMASYLISFGVKHDLTRQGHGEQLLKKIIEKIGERPLYLETHNPQNCTFYSKHGFQAMGQYPLSEAITTYAFKR